MRPKVSSVQLKKGQSLLKKHEGLKNEQRKIERVENNFIDNNHQQSVNANLKNVSMVSNGGKMNRTFLRQTKTHSLVEKRKPETFNNSNVPNHRKLIKPNIGENNVIDSKLWGNQKQEKGKQKIIKTPIRNIAQKNIQQKTIKGKEINLVNPEQKKITATNQSRNQMLNTRKSKFETDSNLKNLKKDQQKQKATQIRSRNISIHPVKNSTHKNTVKKEEEKTQKKAEVKEQKQTEKRQQINQNNNKKQQKTQEEVNIQSSNQNASSREVVNSDLQQDFAIESTNSIVIEERHPNTLINNQTQNLQVIENAQQNNRNQNQNQENLQNLQRQEQSQNQSQQNQRNLDLAALISNTQDIIDFINRLNLNNRIPAFDLMVGQLVQLNLIAQQVHELGQIGNNLGYSLVNVFGTRIRELQTTIINQVGLALISSFSQRMDPQFQALVIRQPSLRSGFSKADIEKTFDQKISFQEVECSICLENVKFGEKVIELQCHHEFHPICIKTWLQNSKKCPLCRAQQQRKTN